LLTVPTEAPTNILDKIHLGLLTANYQQPQFVTPVGDPMLLPNQQYKLEQEQETSPAKFVDNGSTDITKPRQSTSTRRDRLLQL